MSLCNILMKIPGSYYFVIILFSSYYAYRDFLEQRGKLVNTELSKLEKVVIYYIQGILFKVIVTVSSFMALFIANYIFSTLKSFAEISVGTAALLVFLFMWGVIGACGYLTLFIAKGKVPGVTSS